MTGTRVQEDSNVWYSIANRIPAPLPDRITLPDGRVRSDPTTYTDEEIADAGYVPVEPQPGCDIDHEVIWAAGQDGVASWQVIAGDQFAQWARIRRQRDALIGAFAWRIERWHRNDRLGRFQPDRIASLDAYMEALADLTLQPDSFRITWPDPPVATPTPPGSDQQSPIPPERIASSST
jgi:hypothetical protein